MSVQARCTRRHGGRVPLAVDRGSCWPTTSPQAKATVTPPWYRLRDGRNRRGQRRSTSWHKTGGMIRCSGRPRRVTERRPRKGRGGSRDRRARSGCCAAVSAGVATRRCVVSYCGCHGSSSTSARHIERTSTRPRSCPATQMLLAKPSRRAPVTRAHASSATSRRSVSSNDSSPSGRPPGRPQATPSALTSTMSPAGVRHTPEEPWFFPSGGSGCRCQETSQSWLLASRRIVWPSAMGCGRDWPGTASRTARGAGRCYAGGNRGGDAKLDPGARVPSEQVLHDHLLDCLDLLSGYPVAADIVPAECRLRQPVGIQPARLHPAQPGALHHVQPACAALPEEPLTVFRRGGRNRPGASPRTVPREPEHRRMPGIDRPHQRRRARIRRRRMRSEPAKARILAEMPERERAFPDVGRRRLSNRRTRRLLTTHRPFQFRVPGHPGPRDSSDGMRPARQ